MTPAALLDLIEGLHVAAAHPDISLIEQYGKGTQQSPAGVFLKYQSGSEAYIWATSKADGPPAPAELGEPEESRRRRMPHAIRFLIALLEAARPSGVSAWRTVGYPQAGLPMVCGVEVRTDAGSIGLRVTAGSGATDPESDPFPDYVIPVEAIKAAGA